VNDGHVLAWWIVGEIVNKRLAAMWNCRITIVICKITAQNDIDNVHNRSMMIY